MFSLRYGCSSREFASNKQSLRTFIKQQVSLCVLVTVATAVFSRHTWLCDAGDDWRFTDIVVVSEGGGVTTLLLLMGT